MRNLLGRLMLAAPFVAIFFGGALVSELGFVKMVGVFAVTAFVALWVKVAVDLTEG